MPSAEPWDGLGPLRARSVGLDLHALVRHRPDLRDAIAPLNTFVRWGHALATGPGTHADRCAALDAWQDALEDACHGRAQHPDFVALADTLRRHRIPITPLRDLLLAFRVEAAFTGFRDFSALEDHCRSGAASAARLVLHLADERRPLCVARADDLAVALRLADIIVDLGRDARRGRILVPHCELRAFGVPPRALQRGHDVACEELVAFQVARARAWLIRARPLLRWVGPDLREIIIAAMERGSVTLDRITSGAIDPFGGG